MDKTTWAEQWRQNHTCATCPFVINAVDVGIGMIRQCDHTCTGTVGEILQRIEDTEDYDG